MELSSQTNSPLYESLKASRELGWFQQPLYLQNNATYSLWSGVFIIVSITLIILGRNTVC